MRNEGRAGLFNRKALIVAGELSGEIHALHLVNAINTFLPLQWSAIGSERLKAAGVDILYDYREISVTGLSEVLPKARQIWRAYRRLKHYLLESLPSLLILVDFPGFNLRVARMAKKLGIPTVYFIPPQVWAWRDARINRIKRDVGLVISILPFEKALYDRHGIPSVYVGHPFMATVRPRIARNSFLEEAGLQQKWPIITIMPGSRENEIARHMPVLLQVINRLRHNLKNMVVLLPVAENIDRRVIEAFTKDNLEIRLLEGASRDALASSDVALVASGSATLEAAILDCPTIVIYKVSAFSFFAAKHLVKVDYISLPNLIAGREIFPEYIQDLEAESIAERVLHVLNNETASMKNDMEEVRRKLGTSDSYGLARDAVIQFLERIYGPLSATSQVR
ncbi:MAG: lipid-A-disaccharide synthase [Syntrophorhabdales bacterium]